MQHVRHVTARSHRAVDADSTDIRASHYIESPSLPAWKHQDPIAIPGALVGEDDLPIARLLVGICVRTALNVFHCAEALGNQSIFIVR